ncbi:DUF4971 domain-containing protein [uncultured Bacteroides sp.]|jgi:beta-glucanase (GH16 family)|uniref:DUF4971 domain-containing protein n=1 Tax=uncultured Bacteroides sp. TaxID=162156 RepID=UPI0025873B76|nr:DUF4971 domain-containing protein [uncultured Bacteroides sp.]
MLKSYILFVCVFMLCSSCSSSDENGMPARKKYPLTAFSVKVGDSYYHGKIDQTSHKVLIGDIEDANTIIGVDYTLMNDAATISPDPQTFLRAWKKEQQVAVTTDDGQATVYSIELTDFKEKENGILFMDDFDEDILDRNKWLPICRTTADWKMEVSEEMLDVKDGNLVLYADKVDGVYKEGRVETRTKFSFTYGLVEVCARVTKHPNGHFPAIWMMPEVVAYPPGGVNTNPISGEIDIMEHVQQQDFIHQTIHSNYTYHLGIKDPVSTKTTKCDYENYTIYGMKWTEDKITFYVNGIETFSYPNLRLSNEDEVMQWPFREKSAFYLILNMALSRNPDGWAGAIDDANLPAVMEVDWVKVYKLKEE